MVSEYNLTREEQKRAASALWTSVKKVDAKDLSELMEENRELKTRVAKLEAAKSRVDMEYQTLWERAHEYDAASAGWQRRAEKAEARLKPRPMSEAPMDTAILACFDGVWVQVYWVGGPSTGECWLPLPNKRNEGE